MKYVSIQQTIRYSICKISDIACGPSFWAVLVSWYPNHALTSWVCLLMSQPPAKISYIIWGWLTCAWTAMFMHVGRLSCLSVVWTTLWQLGWGGGAHSLPCLKVRLTHIFNIFLSCWVLVLWLNSIPLTPSFCRKKWFVSIPFSAKNNWT